LFSPALYARYIYIYIVFGSVEYIIRNVNYGWFLRYTHANGASLFFSLIYVPIGNGLYFKSYRNSNLWALGIVLFILMMVATTFIAYALS
jgi:ubiquinol-cytochrome c reductase cytochrome b subunit